MQRQGPAVIHQPDPEMLTMGLTMVEEKGYDEADGTLESRCEACRQTVGVRWLSFLVLFILDFAEFIFDWLFFYEIVTLRKGLVFDAPEPALIWTLLGLCLLGTVVFIVETWNTYRAEVNKRPWSLGYTPTLIDVWLVNIPTGIISVKIAACYETAISYVQLAKALAAMFLVLVKIINAIVGYCQELRLRLRYKRTGKKASDLPRLVKLLILVGVITILLCSSLVLALTHMTTVKHRSHTFIRFRVPSSWEEVRLDTDKYFDGVSVFLQHPSFSEPCGIESVSNRWMQLNSINDVIEAEEQGLLISFSHVKPDSRNQYFYVAKIWPYQNKTTRENCYHRDLSTCDLNELNCRSINSMVSKADNFTLRLLFEPPSEFILVGNIDFNGHAMKNSKCIPFSGNETAMNKLIGKLHYFRHSRAGDNPLSFQDDTTRFYVPNSDGMRHVSEAWYTGMLNCKSQGYSAPTYSEYVTVRTC